MIHFSNLISFPNQISTWIHQFECFVEAIKSHSFGKNAPSFRISQPATRLVVHFFTGGDCQVFIFKHSNKYSMRWIVVDVPVSVCVRCVSNIVFLLSSSKILSSQLTGTAWLLTRICARETAVTQLKIQYVAATQRRNNVWCICASIFLFSPILLIHTKLGKTKYSNSRYCQHSCGFKIIHLKFSLHLKLMRNSFVRTSQCIENCSSVFYFILFTHSVKVKL